MILVIGAAASGKREYVHSLGYTEEQVIDGAQEAAAMATQEAVAVSALDDAGTAPAGTGATLEAIAHDERPVLINLQELVFAAPPAAPTLLKALLTKEVVACDEVGAGVIPGEREAREAREATGRLCNQLAQHAEKVIRLVAGIPQMIKG